MEINNTINNLLQSWWLKVVGVIVLIVAIVWVMNRWSGAQYDKKQAEYDAEKSKWAAERVKLEAGIAQRDKQMAERDVQIQALEAAGEAKKKVDDELAGKIAEEAKKIVDAETNAQVPTTCRNRAERICQLFRATDRRFDCTVLFNECSER